MRAGLTVNGRESTFLYEAGNLYAESDEAGAEISRYIRGNGLAGLEYWGKLYGVHRDEQLSTGWVTGEAGDPESAYEYDAFGMLLGSHEDIPNRLLYGGQQYDAETEQYYLRVRYYNPVIGRFMQEDTYRGDGLNLYAYCANNPVMYYDPSGRDDCKINPDAEENVQQENVTGNPDNDISNNSEKTIISPEIEKKILEGQRKEKPKNEVIGGHSPNIVNNDNPDFAVEIIRVNPDGTTVVKYVKGFPDGSVSKIKNKNTLFPDTWSDLSIIDSVKTVGDTPPIAFRERDGSTLHRATVNGVQIEVIKIGSDVTAGYPTGGGATGVLEGFKPVDPD